MRRFALLLIPSVLTVLWALAVPVRAQDEGACAPSGLPLARALPPSAPASDQSTAEPEGPRPLADLTVPGVWDVQYLDRQLGPVQGTAKVAEDGTVTVSLVNPQTGEVSVLTASEVTRKDGGFHLRLEGESPSFGQETGENYPDRYMRVAEGETIRFWAEGVETSLSVGKRKPSDLHTIDLLLTPLSGDRLAGVWSYKADPVLFRDREGKGRQGMIAEDRDGTLLQKGREVWSRRKAVIAGAFVTTEQAPLEGSRNYYPYDTRWHEKDLPPGQIEYWERRLIYVYGENLPETKDDPVVLESEDGQITYRLYGRKADQWGGTPQAEGGFIRLELARGREKLKKLNPALTDDQLKKLDALIIEARVKTGVVPGWHCFRMNGLPVRWQLQFGNVRSNIYFVRPVRVETIAEEHNGEAEEAPSLATVRYERSDTFYLPEVIQVEIELTADVPLDEVPFFLSAQGRLVNVDGYPALYAKRVGVKPDHTLPDGGKLPGAVVYRSRPIYLHLPGQKSYAPPDAIKVVTRSGRKLHARVAHAGVVAGMAAQAEAKVFSSPGKALPEEGRRLVRYFYSDAWEERLNSAASCAGVDITDWSRLPRQKAEEITNRIITEWGAERKIGVTLGDHAAMLLLRDAFVEQMKAQYEALGKRQDDIALMGFRSLIRSSVLSRRSPISRKNVTGPDGGTYPFAFTFDLEKVRSSFGLDEQAAMAWGLRATREAIEAYREDVFASMEKARTLSDCDVVELLKLTGMGFDVVADSVLPRLMLPVIAPEAEEGVPSGRPVNYIRGWVPDRIARSYVSGIGTLSAAFRAQKAYSEIDTQMAVVLASAAVLPFSAFEGALVGHIVANGLMTAQRARAVSALASMVTVSVDVADLSTIVFKEIPDYFEKWEEVRFALGASVVLGAGRLYEAETAAEQWYELAVSVLGAGVGIGAGTFDSALKYTAWRRGAEELHAIERGAAYVNGLSEAGIEALSLSQRTDLFAFLDDAARVKRLAGETALTKLQRKALKAFDAILKGRQGGAALPEWLGKLHPQVALDIAPIMHRPSLRRLMSRDAKAVQDILRGPDRELALEILQYNPFSTADQFLRRINRINKRITQSSQRLFDLASLDPFLEDVAKIDQTGWEFKVATEASSETGKTEIEVTATLMTAEGPKKAQFLRAWDPDKQEFIFSSAFLSPLPNRIENLPVAMIPGRGTPTTTFMNLIAMRAANIAFGENPASGVLLKKLRLKTVINVQAAIHLEWLRKVYEGNVPPQAYRHLFSVEYAESALNMAGYEIKSIKVGSGSRGPVSAAVHLYEPARGESEAVFFERFYGSNWEEEITALEYEDWFDIEIEVQPRAANDNLPLPPAANDNTPLKLHFEDLPDAASGGG